MFYKEEEIAEDLICPRCSKKFQDPRVLPCGQTYCQPCIQDILVNDENLLKCPSCKSSHPVPDKSDFPPNLIVVRLLKKSSNEVYRGTSVENLKEYLNKLRSNIDKFEANKNKSADLVREYCFELSNDIDLAAEKQIQIIQNRREELLNEVKKYQDTCVSKIKSNQTELNQFDKFINEIKSFCSQWDSYLKGFKIEFDKVEKLIEISAQNLEKIEYQSSLLTKFTFDGGLLKFKKKITDSFDELASILGEMSLEKHAEVASSKDEFKKLSLKEHLAKNDADIESIKELTIECLGNGKYCIAYLNSKQILSFNIFDNSILLLNLQTSRPRESFRMDTYSNKIFIGSNIKQTAECVLYAFDDRLNSQGSFQIDSARVLLLASNDSNVYALIKKKTDLFKSLMVFDHKLETLRVLNPTFMPFLVLDFNLISRAKARDGKFYTIELGFLVVFDLNTGSLIKRRKISGESFVIMNDDVYVLDVAKQQVSVYNITLNENLVKEKKLNFDTPVQVILNSQNRICYFDKKNLILYY